MKILYEGGSDTLTEKKSRFIATTMPVESEEQAVFFIEAMRKQYWDASHNCFAYVIGKKHETARCSDDGEPSQTAGRPMLDVLLGEDIHNACVVVTRYFGGTLLGTGGLVRAYQKAASLGLKNSVTVEKQPAARICVTSDYNALGKIQYLAASRNIAILDTEYTDQVILNFIIPLDQEDSFLSDLTEGTNGKVLTEKKGDVYFGLVDGKVHIF